MYILLSISIAQSTQGKFSSISSKLSSSPVFHIMCACVSFLFSLATIVFINHNANSLFECVI